MEVRERRKGEGGQVPFSFAKQSGGRRGSGTLFFCETIRGRRGSGTLFFCETIRGGGDGRLEVTPLRFNQSEIIEDILEHIRQGGGEFSDWCVGSAKDSQCASFGRHVNEDSKDGLLYREAYTTYAAEEVLERLVKGCGLRPERTAVPQPGRIVFVYRPRESMNIEGSGQWAEGRRQWAERSRQKAEGSGQKAEGSGQKAVGRRQKAVDRRQKAVDRRQKAVDRRQKPRVRRRQTASNSPPVREIRSLWRPAQGHAGEPCHPHGQQGYGFPRLAASSPASPHLTYASAVLGFPTSREAGPEVFEFIRSLFSRSSLAIAISTSPSSAAFEGPKIAAKRSWAAFHSG